MDKTYFENKINCKKRWLWLWFQLIALVCHLRGASAQMTSCGGYIDLGSGSYQIYSPEYPNQYPDVSNCIWMIEASNNYRVNLTFTFTGERYNGECSDYIEIRDGGHTSPLIGTYCDTHTDVSVQTTDMWMYVQLRSDQITGSGAPMEAQARAVYNSTDSGDSSDRVPECRSYEFECPNRVCISMSYRCDDYNDCGCIDDCDEDGCGSLPIDTITQILISVFVGISVFIFICFLAYFIERSNSAAQAGTLTSSSSSADNLRREKMQKRVQRISVYL